MDHLTVEKAISNLSLVHSSDQENGFRRYRRGKGFIYFDEKEQIRNRDIIERIKSLKIPPNWNNVWISSSDNGYLQATGMDAKGRKQYIYHADWINYQQTSKFERLLEFGKSLPLIRETINKDLRKNGWPKEKVIALIISILDTNYLRIGNRFYSETNNSFGLTTLRRKHLTIKDNMVIFSFKGKSNIYHNIKIENKRFARLIKQCSELPGYEVFRYSNEAGKSMPVTSHDVNEYLEQITGVRFTSKTFRTWGGTVLALKKYPEAKNEVADNKKLKFKRTLVKKVANELGNTITVCEQYYIHPKVLNELINEDFNIEKIHLNDQIPGLDDDELRAISILNSTTV